MGTPVDPTKLPGWERVQGAWQQAKLPPSLNGLNAQAYWNLPKVEGDTTDFNGVWDPRLDKTAQNVLVNRAQERARMSRLKEDQDIAALPPGVGTQTKFMQDFNHRMDGMNTLTWDPYFEALNEAGEGGRDVKIAGGGGLPEDTHLGTVPLSMQSIPGATLGGYDSFGFPTSISMGGGSKKKAAAPKDKLSELEGAGQYIDENGHVQIRK